MWRQQPIRAGPFDSGSCVRQACNAQLRLCICRSVTSSPLFHWPLRTNGVDVEDGQDCELDLTQNYLLSAQASPTCSSSKDAWPGAMAAAQQSLTRTFAGACPAQDKYRSEKLENRNRKVSQRCLATLALYQVARRSGAIKSHQPAVCRAPYR